MRHARAEPVLETCRLAAAACACQGVRSAARAVSRLYESHLAPTGLTPTQFSLLVALNLRGPTPLSRLAEQLVLDRTSLYRAVRPLVRRGQVRVGPGQDRREKEASLTGSGRRVLAEALPRWQAAQASLVATLGREAWETLSAGLGLMVAAAESAGARGGADSHR